MRGLAGKVILITGGSSGIGEATVQRLASEGAIVVMGDIYLDRAEDVVEAGMLALVRHIAANWGRQDIRANAVSPGAVAQAPTDRAGMAFNAAADRKVMEGNSATFALHRNA